MEFFDKKQDVIDLQLTQFGRYMLSRGLFSPVYYTFHDDNILYNSETAGFTELQNESEFRINETSTVQPQVSYSSLEREFQTQYKKIASLTGDEKARSPDFQPSAIKNYTFSSPIGTAKSSVKYAPSWNIEFLKGKLTGSTNFVELTDKTGGKNILKIPQLESKITIDYIRADQANLGEDVDLVSDFGILTDEENMFILLSIEEENSPTQKKNFDIEVFEIQEEIENDRVIETLRPLLLTIDKNTNGFEFIEQVSPSFDTAHVQHYFDLLIDDQIDEEILCKYDPVQKKTGVFANRRTLECESALEESDREVYDIYEDEIDDPGEVC